MLQHIQNKLNMYMIIIICVLILDMYINFIQDKIKLSCPLKKECIRTDMVRIIGPLHFSKILF